MKTESAALELQQAWELAKQIKSDWRAGAEPDAAVAIEAHPALALNRSIVIDLAYEEYLLRECAGTAPDPGRFACAFPEFQASVLDMLEAHCLLLANPELLEPPAAEWPEVGSKFEGLELRAELGRGAFGRAYLAFDSSIGRLRAVKLAPGGSAEAKLIGRLIHPNVIDVCWTRTVGGRTAVCMPFVGAATLADAIAATGGGRPATAQTILDASHTRLAGLQPDSRSPAVVLATDSFLVGASAIAARIADAVDYLHRNGVVHGDVKPSNVVLEPGGAPQVIDFNLAAGEEPATAIRGTPAYMAPELLDATLSGRSATGVDGSKADLFALGVTLIEFFTGRHPFRCTSDGTLASFAAIVSKGPPDLPASIPAPIARLLRACLAVDPRNRPASASELTRALDSFVRHERTRGARRKRQLLLLAVIASIGALASFAMAPHRTEAAESHFQRGIRLLHEGKPDAARADFLTAHEKTGHPESLAFAAYCYALTGEHDVAIERGRLALADGAASAEVENNLGHSLVQRSSADQAMLHLNSALLRRPDLTAARYNRALAAYKLLLKGRRELAPQAIADIEHVLAAQPGSAVHLDAARLYVACASTDAALLGRALDQLELAAQAGIDPAAFRDEPIFVRNLTPNSRFLALCQRPLQPALQAIPFPLLVEPQP